MAHPNTSSNTQTKLKLQPQETAAQVLDRIRTDSRDNNEKGEWFEQLVCHAISKSSDFDVQQIHLWKQWSEKENLMPGFSNRDIGVDAVAQLNSGEWVAIQCKCFDNSKKVAKGDIDKFLGGSQHKLFEHRWIVTTSPLGPAANTATKQSNPPISQIDFHDRLAHQIVGTKAASRPVRKPLPRQQKAIDDVLAGFQTADRGQLIMPCGTGKTFTSHQISEQKVPDGGTILFAAPSIALVSQARREWLRYTTRPLTAIVVCSDSTAGKEDLEVKELECPVIDDPKTIADKLKSSTNTKVVFCTYQSIDKVVEAQHKHGSPVFDLAIADEAHRTTGALETSSQQVSNFQMFHDSMSLNSKDTDHIKAALRLYMTATPRVYSDKSKTKALLNDAVVSDMDDYNVFGWEFHRLSFRDAVAEPENPGDPDPMLSDYRVIVLGVAESSVTAKTKASLSDPDDEIDPDVTEVARVKAVSLAINGVVQGNPDEAPEYLPRSLAFASSRNRSKWYVRSLVKPRIKDITTRQMPAGKKARQLETVHLDATSSAFKRNEEIRLLREADDEGKCRLISNVKLFTEGVDIPALDAVVFFDPKGSQVDIVQAVGRVMRKSPDKKFGYIIIPVVLPLGGDIIETLANSKTKFKPVGKVLQALRSHDSRIAENPQDFIMFASDIEESIQQQTNEAANSDDPIQQHLVWEKDEGIFAHIAENSGLGNHGQMVANDIAWHVGEAAKKLQEVEGLCDELADTLDLPAPFSDKKDEKQRQKEIADKEKHISVVAALMLYNACLLHRRLGNTVKGVMPLLETVNATATIEMLAASWRQILKHDYSPVFQPALDILNTLPEKHTSNIIKAIAQSANSEADSLSELGYDHAGPLYHKILGTAKSDGAYYTKNSSAVLLATLALDGMDMDWSDREAVEKLRIMDPACGTGTLLMAAMQTIKNKVDEATPDDLTDTEKDQLHKALVEQSICGLDINKHGIQLAACNLTLGAPTVDYQQMNLATMPHGVKNGKAKAGSLELLMIEDSERDTVGKLFSTEAKNLDEVGAEQTDAASEINFPIRGLDLVIMNEPFTANDKKGLKFDAETLKAMQLRELEIKKHLKESRQPSADIVHSNSIGTYFTAIGDKLLNRENGVLAKVVPTTSCTNTSGIPQRKFLADQYHVETIITSHDPKTPNFVHSSGIHETLLVLRRKNDKTDTCFVSFKAMPNTIADAKEAALEIKERRLGKWVGVIYDHPQDKIAEGDWRPCQFYDPELYNAMLKVSSWPGVEVLENLHKLGPPGQTIRDCFKQSTNNDGYKVFWSVSAKLRQCMDAEPEQVVEEKSKKAGSIERLHAKAGHVLFPTNFNTQSGRLLAIFSSSRSLGNSWVPVTSASEAHAKAICAWFNSTAGSLGFFNNRAKTLSFPAFSQDTLNNLLLPDFNQVSPDLLIAAFEQSKNMIIEPWKEAASDPVRAILDEAAAKTIGLDPEQVKDWRERLAKEPTISNERV